MWDVIVLIPDNCFSIYFVIDFFIKEMLLISNITCDEEKTNSL